MSPFNMHLTIVEWITLNNPINPAHNVSVTDIPSTSISLKSWFQWAVSTIPIPQAVNKICNILVLQDFHTNGSHHSRNSDSQPSDIEHMKDTFAIESPVIRKKQILPQAWMSVFQSLLFRSDRKVINPSNPTEGWFIAMSFTFSLYIHLLQHTLENANTPSIKTS
jgi:hypothetical protein